MAKGRNRKRFSRRERDSLESYVNAKPDDHVARLAASDYLEEHSLHRGDGDLALLRSDHPQVALMRTAGGKTKAVVGIHHSAIHPRYRPLVHQHLVYSAYEKHGIDDDPSLVAGTETIHPTSIKRIIDDWERFRSQLPPAARKIVDEFPDSMPVYAGSIWNSDNLFDRTDSQGRVRGPFRVFEPHLGHIEEALPNRFLFLGDDPSDGLLHFGPNGGRGHGDDTE